MTKKSVPWKSVGFDIREVGEKLLRKQSQGEVALLATINSQGRPAIAPVCPIFTDDGVFVLVGKNTPKYQHLLKNPGYALHAQVGADDLEFQISGQGQFIGANHDRSQILAAISFPSFDETDPIIELLVSRALVVRWVDGKMQKHSWTSG